MKVQSKNKKNYFKDCLAFLQLLCLPFILEFSYFSFLFSRLSYIVLKYLVRFLPVRNCGNFCAHYINTQKIIGKASLSVSAPVPFTCSY